MTQSADQIEEELVLALEVEIERPFGDPYFADDVVNHGPLVAESLEMRLSDLHDRFALG